MLRDKHLGSVLGIDPRLCAVTAREMQNLQSRKYLEILYIAHTNEELANLDWKKKSERKKSQSLLQFPFNIQLP